MGGEVKTELAVRPLGAQARGEAPTVPFGHRRLPATRMSPGGSTSGAPDTLACQRADSALRQRLRDWRRAAVVAHRLLRGSLVNHHFEFDDWRDGHRQHVIQVIDQHE